MWPELPNARYVKNAENHIFKKVHPPFKTLSPFCSVSIYK
jgi:hypothetical protein